MEIRIIILRVSIYLIGALNSANGQVYFGIKSGLNLSNQIHDGFVIDVGSKIIPTYMVGGLAEFVISKACQIETGLQLQVKGAEGTSPIKFRTSLNYLYLPVKLDYNVKKITFGFGFYDAIAIGGKNEENGQNEELKLGEGIHDLYSRVDYGIIFEGGYLFDKIRLTFNYDLGLGNIIPQDIKDNYASISIKNVVFGIALSYFFLDNK